MYGEASSDKSFPEISQGGQQGYSTSPPSTSNTSAASSAVGTTSSNISSAADLTLYIVFGVAVAVFVLVLIIIVKILKRKNPNPNGYTLTSTGNDRTHFNHSDFFLKSWGTPLTKRNLNEVSGRNVN